MERLLEVKDLRTYFFTKAGVGKAVNGISFTLDKGEILGIIGESGSGKSIAVKSLLQIVPRPGRITGGQIIFEGTDLLQNPKEIVRIRGREITMIFQEPMTSLNPVLTIGRQMTEGIRLHLGLSKEEAEKRACQYLRRVKITDPEEILTRYPHHLSGGMRQRVMIAMALCTDTKILISDEATTALDVTIQQQIIYLLKELRDQLGMAIIFITHDMGVINEIADNTAVMYCGRIQEYASTYEIMKNPKHPYTRALLKAIPRIDDSCERLSTIPGSVPSLLDLPEGCSFCGRCEECQEKCSSQEPPLFQLADGHRVRCWKYEGTGREDGVNE